MVMFIRNKQSKCAGSIIQTGFFCKKVGVFVVHIHFSNPVVETSSADLQIFKGIT